jgi:hypothetical protein
MTLQAIALLVARCRASVEPYTRLVMVLLVLARLRRD